MYLCLLWELQKPDDMSFDDMANQQVPDVEKTSGRKDQL